MMCVHLGLMTPSPKLDEFSMPRPKDIYLKLKQKCHCNRHFIINKLKKKIVQFGNKFSFEIKHIA